jgi:hypothetical protein
MVTVKEAAKDSVETGVKVAGRETGAEDELPEF